MAKWETSLDGYFDEILRKIETGIMQGSMTASYRMLAVPKSRPDCCMPRLSYCSEQVRVSHVVSLDPSGAFFGKIPTTSMAG